MKKQLVALSVLCLMLATTWSACSEDIDVIGDWEEIPIVYAVFDPPTLQHYVRLEKAFLDPETSAFEVAQRPDSLFFDDVTVLLFSAERPNDPLTLLDTMHLVNGDTLGLEREEGIFAESPNLLYRTLEDVVQGRYYELRIESARTGKTYRAAMRAVDLPTNSDAVVVVPSPLSTIQWSYVPTRYTRIRFNQVDHAGVYDLFMRFNYAEYEVDGNGAEVPGTRELKSEVWQLRNRIIPNISGPIEVEVPGESFYRFVANNIEPFPENVSKERCALNMEVLLDIGGRELAAYLDQQNERADLISGVQPIEPFSNLEGGYGVFSSRIKVEDTPVELALPVHDSLRFGQFTRNLSFSGDPCN